MRTINIQWKIPLRVHIDTLSDGTALGRVMFGDYSKGLEYFVGHTVSDKIRPGDFKLSMAFKRQVSKLVFRKFTRWRN